MAVTGRMMSSGDGVLTYSSTTPHHRMVASALRVRVRAMRRAPRPWDRGVRLGRDVAGQQAQVGGAEALADIEVVPEGVRQGLGADGVESLHVLRGELQIGGRK